MRAQLRALFDITDGIQVVGESGDGADAVSKSHDLQPDVVLMDIRIPKLDGINATRVIKQDNPDTRVVIFSAFDNKKYRREAKAAGASDYLLKGDPIERIIGCIKDHC